MNNKVKMSLGLGLVVIAGVCLHYFVPESYMESQVVKFFKEKQVEAAPVEDNSSRVKELEDQLKVFKDKEAADARLGQWVLERMQRVKAKLSPLRQQTLTRIIVNILNDVFEKEEHKKAFIAVLAIESGFDRTAQSPTGPRGLSQVAKLAFSEGLGKCSQLDHVDGDVWDDSINILAGACYFRAILENEAQGDVFSAIISYNQGSSSEDFAMYKKYGRLTKDEPKNYLSRFVFLTDPKISNSEEGE